MANASSLPVAKALGRAVAYGRAFMLLALSSHLTRYQRIPSRLGLKEVGRERRARALSVLSMQNLGTLLVHARQRVRYALIVGNPVIRPLSAYSLGSITSSRQLNPRSLVTCTQYSLGTLRGTMRLHPQSLVVVMQPILIVIIRNLHRVPPKAPGRCQQPREPWQPICLHHVAPRLGMQWRIQLCLGQGKGG